MTDQSKVSEHYARSDLGKAIEAGIAALGKAPGSVTVDDLAPVDEFHIGGRKASEEFIGQLGFSGVTSVLDIGCGLGGTARFVATRFGSRIAGIDLTADYVETGNALCRMVGLDAGITLHQGNALAMPFAGGSFDGAYMMHVGMNIEDKEKLALEVARVLRPGATFGIYDVMRTGPGDLAFPVPWASSASTSAVAEPERYRRALEAAGFVVTSERNRRDFALAFFADLRAKTAAAGGPPPIGLHLLMGQSTPQKVANMIDNITKGAIAPVELIGRRA